MSSKEDKNPEQQSNTGTGSGGDGQGGEDGSLPQQEQAPGDCGNNVPLVSPLVTDVGVGGGQQAQGSSGSGHRKRRGRPPKGKEQVGEAAAAGEAPEGDQPKKKGKFHAPEVPRPCSECGKQFNNYKALFGHMRSHPGRQWRGAYPPPISPPSSPVRDIEQQGVQLASSLLSIGQRLLGASEEGGDGTERILGGQPAGTGAHPRGLNIDLNMAQDPMQLEPTSPSREAEKKDIDLNREASDDSEGADK